MIGSPAPSEEGVRSSRRGGQGARVQSIGGGGGVIIPGTHSALACLYHPSFFSSKSFSDDPSHHGISLLITFAFLFPEEDRTVLMTLIESSHSLGMVQKCTEAFQKSHGRAREGRSRLQGYCL